MKTGLYLGEIPVGKIIVTSVSSGGVNLQSKTITPTKSSQTVIADSDYEGLSSVTVNPIPDIYINTSDADAAANEIQAGKTAYVDGELVTGNLPQYGSQTYTNAVIEKSGDAYEVSATNSTKHIMTVNGKVYVRGAMSDFGEATADQVLEGSTFTSASGIKITGTHVCESGVDASDATATAADILEGKTAYIDGSGEATTGTMKNNSSLSLSVNGKTVSIPANGYYTTSQSASVATATLNAPYATSATVNSNGSITVQTAYIPTVGYNGSTTTKTGSTILTNVLSTETWTLTDINGNTSTMTVVKT